MSKPTVSSRTVRCPGCGGPSLFGPDNPCRPFCSERCKNLDFGAWASEAYRVDFKPEPQEDDPSSPS